MQKILFLFSCEMFKHISTECQVIKLLNLLQLMISIRHDNIWSDNLYQHIIH